MLNKFNSIFQRECAKEATSGLGLYATGCFKFVEEQIKQHEAIIGSVAIIVVVVMVSMNTLSFRLPYLEITHYLDIYTNIKYH